MPILLLITAACRKEQDTPLNVDFEYTVQDGNYTIPVTILFSNKTTGAEGYRWSFSGGSPAAYSQKHPGPVRFSSAGTITVTLEAWNEGERKTKTLDITIDSVVRASFTPIARINSFAPVTVDVQNTSQGATKFNWTLGGGVPAGSFEKHPQGIAFANAGTYRILLEARNERGVKDTVSKLITVLPSLSAAFDIEPSFDDDDYEAPLTATLANHTISATTHQWNAPGGTLSNAADSIPTVHYSTPGTYTVTCTAGNGKQTQTVTRTITVKPNTFMRTFTNVQLGINTAHSTVGSFFSTKWRRVYKAGEVTPANGPWIDLAYYGHSETFALNKFITPDSAQYWTFAAIPGATYTQRINKQETCNCGPAFTATDFDNMTNGNVLNPLTITETPGGITPFSNALVPRVVLFKNSWGKKGAVKIKQFVNNGQQSYIVCDIKVQKD